MTSTAIYKEEDLKDIKDLLGIFVEYETVPRGSAKIRSIQDQVNILFARDYEFSKIDNSIALFLSVCSFSWCLYACQVMEITASLIPLI